MGSALAVRDTSSMPRLRPTTAASASRLLIDLAVPTRPPEWHGPEQLVVRPLAGGGVHCRVLPHSLSVEVSMLFDGSLPNMDTRVFADAGPWRRGSDECCTTDLFRFPGACPCGGRGRPGGLCRLALVADDAGGEARLARAVPEPVERHRSQRTRWSKGGRPGGKGGVLSEPVRR